MSTQVITQQISDYFKTQPVLKAWIFGSFARGEQREDSDVDLLVKLDRSLPIGLFAFAYASRTGRDLAARLILWKKERCARLYRRPQTAT